MDRYVTISHIRLPLNETSNCERKDSLTVSFWGGFSLKWPSFAFFPSSILKPLWYTWGKTTCYCEAYLIDMEGKWECTTTLWPGPAIKLSEGKLWIHSFLFSPLAQSIPSVSWVSSQQSSRGEGAIHHRWDSNGSAMVAWLVGKDVGTVAIQDISEGVCACDWGGGEEWIIIQPQSPERSPMI